MTNTPIQQDTDTTTIPSALDSVIDEDLLHRLADVHGVGTSFHGWDGLQHDVSPTTLIQVLGALGVAAHSNEQIEAALADAEVAPWRRLARRFGPSPPTSER